MYNWSTIKAQLFKCEFTTYPCTSVQVYNWSNTNTRCSKIHLIPSNIVWRCRSLWADHKRFALVRRVICGLSDLSIAKELQKIIVVSILKKSQIHIMVGFCLVVAKNWAIWPDPPGNQGVDNQGCIKKDDRRRVDSQRSWYKSRYSTPPCRQLGPTTQPKDLRL